MAEPEFPCRTKKLHGINYRVKFYDSEGSLRISTSYRDDKVRAERHVEHMQTHAPGLRGEITEHPYTEEVCIECGKEVW